MEGSDEEKDSSVDNTDEEEEEEEEEQQQDTHPHTTTPTPASPPLDPSSLQLTASLGLVLALLHTTGAFVAPYLPRMLSLLLSVCAMEGHLGRVGGEIRDGLPVMVPSRLLLPALVGHGRVVLEVCMVGVGGLVDVGGGVLLLGGGVLVGGVVG